MPGIGLKQTEIDAAFGLADLRAQFPPILDTKALAAMLGRPVKTVRAWLAKGRFKNAAIKRGKEYTIWRDRAIAQWFNGAEWHEIND